MLLVLKKASEKYSNSTCRSKCCNWNWNNRFIRNKSTTNESL